MTTVVAGGFEWDSEKAASNPVNHNGVTFEEAVTVFADASALDLADAVHPDRIITIGYSVATRILLVVTIETGDRIRIISARRATRTERALYEGT